MNIPEMLLVGFTVGLTGAMAPGPMLFATIESSLKRGWRAGPEVVSGHAVLEIIICVLIITGMASVVNSKVITMVSLIGGFSLCMFGWSILKSRKNVNLETELTVTNPAVAGIITSASNPYFWIWWLSAGTGIIMEGLKIGVVAAWVFVIGHWTADGVWYSFVSGSFSRGRTLISHSMYRNILTACGLFLIAFGAWFIIHIILS